MYLPLAVAAVFGVESDFVRCYIGMTHDHLHSILDQVCIEISKTIGS